MNTDITTWRILTAEQAIEMASEIMVRAEQSRAEERDREAAVGIQYEDDNGQEKS